MSDDTPATPSRYGRGLLKVIERRLPTADPTDLLGNASLRFIRRAEQVMDRLDSVARTMEKVAQVELQIVERLVPIVDHLGELVKYALDDARTRRRAGDELQGAPTASDTDPRGSTDDE